MMKTIRITITAIGTLAAVGLAAPALADTQRMPMYQQQGGIGMMGGAMGGYDPMGGMMNSGGNMWGGGMMGPGMMSGGMGMTGPMMGFDLSDEQVEQMTEMHEERVREHAERMADLPALQYRLNRELSRDDPDAERVGELFLEIHQQGRQLMRDRTAMEQQMMQILTEEQREQMQEMWGPMSTEGGRRGTMPMHNR